MFRDYDREILNLLLEKVKQDGYSDTISLLENIIFNIKQRHEVHGKTTHN